MEPPVDTPGDWVERDAFSGRKSFGFFVCQCGKRWLSAHAFPNYTQGCKSCEDTCLPRYLWVNQHSSFEDYFEDDKDRDNKSPHDRERCEACAKGVCLESDY